jgi:cell division protein FtsB
MNGQVWILVLLGLLVCFAVFGFLRTRAQNKEREAAATQKGALEEKRRDLDQRIKSLEEEQKKR